MKWWLLGLFVAAGTVIAGAPVHAQPSLKVQPLQYEESLEKGERKKGFIDVTNPLTQVVKVNFSVEGFRQIDNKGNLAFYQDEQLSEAIQLDYYQFEIPANKTLRLYFIADGTKLPSGDVFAAIFARTANEISSGASPSVRVGTLLILSNGTPSARNAEITELTASPVQVGASLDGVMTIKNNAPSNTSNGFFPVVTVSVWPFGSVEKVKGPLVFAGNAREVPIHLPSNQLGVYKMSASIGDSHKDVWLLLVTGVWRWILPLLLIFVGVVGYILLRRHRLQSKHT
ncbi:MAG TPA: hypothetical protein VGO98_01055 [Candidatus Saccharimonadales bacterium]|jgi:hypothetical protein|nr:hypothetical protein [Candidatus Saccharimonadales bacterium]